MLIGGFQVLLPELIPAYFWCGYVESAIITGYDQNTGIVTLDTPFTNSGTMVLIRAMISI